MAWWKTGDGDDVTGDWPADLLGAALGDLLGEPGTVPLAELLGAWQDALNDARGRWLAAEPCRVSALTRTDAGTGPLGPPVLTEAAPSSSDPARRRRASKALQDLARAYQDAKDRLPRVSEVRASLQFSLAGPLEDGRTAEGPLQLVRLDIDPCGPDDR